MLTCRLGWPTKYLANDWTGPPRDALTDQYFLPQTVKSPSTRIPNELLRCLIWAKSATHPLTIDLDTVLLLIGLSSHGENVLR